MKKILLLLAVATLTCFVIQGQGQTNGHQKTGFLTLTGGPSIPLGDFASTDLYNEQAGFAKTGLNLDLQGGYYFTKNVAVSGSAFFSQYTLDEQKLTEQFAQEFPGSQFTLSVDHWQYYGIVVGPMITLDLSPRTFLDFDFMTGLANANSPKTEVTLEGTQATQSEDWTAVVPLRIGTTARFQIGKKGYLGAGLHYMYMKPEFEATVAGETSKFQQKIEAVNVTFGVGIRF
jgi:hypothetical protein